MNFKNNILILFFCLLFFLLFVFFERSLAQERSGIAVSPFIIEEELEPGQHFVKTINLTNNSPEKKNFNVYLMDFEAKKESGQAVLLPVGSKKFSLSKIIELPSQIELLPKESKKIDINFKIPQENEVGGYYGAIIFASKAPEIEKKESFVVLSQQVGVLVFLSVPQASIEKAIIREFTTDKKYYYKSPFKVKFISRVENLGNVYLKPTGTIKIENMFGKEKAVLPFNAEGFNILPESIRKFENEWQGSLALGKYNAFLVLNYGTPLEQGGKGLKMIDAKTSFWIIPWQIIFILFLILGFLTIIFLLVRRYKRIVAKLKKE